MKKFFLKYGLFILIAILFFVGILISADREERELNLQTIELTDFKVICGEREKLGKKYLWVKYKNAGSLASVSRIKNCDKYKSKKYKKAEVSYKEVNNAIYGLTLDGEKVIVPDEVIASGKSSFLTMYFIFCLFLVGIYIDLKRRFKKEENK